MIPLTDRELAAVLGMARKLGRADRAGAAGLRKLLTMYHTVLDSEGYIEAGLLGAFLRELAVGEGD